jgi:hypothetical protein
MSWRKELEKGSSVSSCRREKLLRLLFYLDLSTPFSVFHCNFKEADFFCSANSGGENENKCRHQVTRGKLPFVNSGLAL